jgi:prepilin-type N-terminal cleavage/methylation domain-containing protein
MNSRQMNRNNHGFTILEIVVVLVLISILAATVFTRSITTNQINFVGQADKIQNHFRYAHSLAMKRKEFWGISSNGSEYWLYQWESAGDELNPKKLPGQELDKISLSDLGLKMNLFKLFFDNIGKPYIPSPGTNTPLSSDLEIKIETLDESQSRSFYITPETGLMRD